MTRSLKMTFAAAALSGALALSGCTTENDSEATDSSPSEEVQINGDQDANDSNDGQGDMDHPMDGGPVPEGMTEATDPEYEMGSEVTLTADHMEGMEGAPATIVGAYETSTYSVDYVPTGGGDPVTDHKWVVHEELQNPGDERLPDGSEVTLLADHMEGMNEATATIASSTEDTVYVVDYEADGMTMTNHKWVVESEIETAS